MLRNDFEETGFPASVLYSALKRYIFIPGMYEESSRTRFLYDKEPMIDFLFDVFTSWTVTSKIFSFHFFPSKIAASRLARALR